MTQQQQNEIHGHDVLDMMAASGTTYSRDSLIAAINERFGDNARFCICSGGGMSAPELVESLIERGKFTGPDDAFAFNPAARCDH